VSRGEAAPAAHAALALCISGSIMCNTTTSSSSSSNFAVNPKAAMDSGATTCLLELNIWF
jgi:hypothetical protein